jgi:hypothetical protein
MEPSTKGREVRSLVSSLNHSCETPLKRHAGLKTRKSGARPEAHATLCALMSAPSQTGGVYLQTAFTGRQGIPWHADATLRRGASRRLQKVSRVRNAARSLLACIRCLPLWPL